MKQDIIKPVLLDIMLLRLSVSLLPGRRNADLGGCMSRPTAADWKWRTELLIVLTVQQNMFSLEAIDNNLKSSYDNTFTLFWISSLNFIINLTSPSMLITRGQIIYYRYNIKCISLFW